MNRRTKARITADLQARLGLLAGLRELNREGEEQLLSEREADVLDTGADRAAASVCATCRKPIEWARLQALPEAAHCLECAADFAGVRGNA